MRTSLGNGQRSPKVGGSGSHRAIAGFHIIAYFVASRPLLKSSDELTHLGRRGYNFRPSGKVDPPITGWEFTD